MARGLTLGLTLAAVKLTTITGPPETGKFTIAELLKTLVGPPHVVCTSTGRILKDHVAKHTPIGLQIVRVREELVPGCYMPDSLVIPAVDEALNRLFQEKHPARIILSGFPKTQAQADHLSELPVTGIIDIVAVPEQSVPKKGKGARYLHHSWLCYMGLTEPMLSKLRDSIVHLDRAKPVLNLLEAAIPAITPDSAEQVRMFRSLCDRRHPVHAQIAQIRA